MNDKKRPTLLESLLQAEAKTRRTYSIRIGDRGGVATMVNELFGTASPPPSADEQTGTKTDDDGA